VDFRLNSFLYLSLSRSLSLSRNFSFSLSFLGSFSKKDFSILGSAMFSLDLFSLIGSCFIVLACDKDFSKARVLFVSQSISQFGCFAIRS